MDFLYKIVEYLKLLLQMDVDQGFLPPEIVTGTERLRLSKCVILHRFVKHLSILQLIVLVYLLRLFWVMKECLKEA